MVRGNETSNKELDRSITVVNRKNGLKFFGDTAPKLKNLATWLDSNPEWDVHESHATIVREKGRLPQRLHDRIRVSEKQKKEAKAASSKQQQAAAAEAAAQAQLQAMAGLDPFMMALLQQMPVSMCLFQSKTIYRLLQSTSSGGNMDAMAQMQMQMLMAGQNPLLMQNPSALFAGLGGQDLNALMSLMGMPTTNTTSMLQRQQRFKKNNFQRAPPQSPSARLPLHKRRPKQRPA